jgi:flagellar FliL protein
MADEEQESGDEKKSSKKLIIIIAAVVLLLGGGGAGYYFMFMGDPSEETEQSEQVEEAEPIEYFYFDIEKPFIVQFPKGAGARLLQVSISIQVTNEAFIEDLKKHQPMLRNNLLMIINDSKPGELKTSQGKEALKNKMLEEVNSIMSKMGNEDKIENLFFTSLVMQ